MASHSALMIVSFQHKGLRLFYETRSTRGIRADHAKRLKRVLHAMHVAPAPDYLDLPGWHLHPLKGDLANYWSVRVSGNWRLIFRFSEGGFELIDYLDYH